MLIHKSRPGSITLSMSTAKTILNGQRWDAAQSFDVGNGPSRVVEMRQKNGQWVAFMADWMPPALDDAIKGKRWEMAKALGKMCPRDLWDFVPMVFQ